MRKAFIVCVLIMLCGAGARGDTKFLEYLPKPLPVSELHDLRGREFTLDKLEGNVLLVHFWATWCAACMDEMKSLNQLQKVLSKEPVIIIPVSEDFKGSEAVQKFYTAFNLKHLPAFIDKNNKWFKEMKVSSLPATFIVDTQGRNVMFVSGAVDWLDEKNIAMIKKYIASRQPDNQDYRSLLAEHAVVVDNKSKPSTSQAGMEEMLKAIETDVALKIDEENLKQGEINMSNDAPQEPDFTTRRSVNHEHKQE